MMPYKSRVLIILALFASTAMACDEGDDEGTSNGGSSGQTAGSSESAGNDSEGNDSEGESSGDESESGDEGSTGSGAAAFGEVCHASADCESGMCAYMAGENWRLVGDGTIAEDGICTVDCDFNDECHIDYWCDDFTFGETATNPDGRYCRPYG